MSQSAAFSSVYPEYSQSILVTDFDGTVTLHDFYKLAVDRFLTPQDMTPWRDYRSGAITHFEAIRRIFERIRAPESEILKLMSDMRPDPALPHAVEALHQAGWQIIVASAGCGWYVERILRALNVHIEVHANPGHYAEGGPLIMEAPTTDPFYSPELGVDKAAIVRFHQQRGATVAYCGDGYTDEPAAMLVEPQLRFARADLAEALTEKNVPFQPFAVWSDVGKRLLGEASEDADLTLLKAATGKAR